MVMVSVYGLMRPVTIGIGFPALLRFSPEGDGGQQPGQATGNTPHLVSPEWIPRQLSHFDGSGATGWWKNPRWLPPFDCWALLQYLKLFLQEPSHNGIKLFTILSKILSVFLEKTRENFPKIQAHRLHDACASHGIVRTAHTALHQRA
ncbi:MAG: hypothetical protein AB7P12_02650 [Alphaproteobacteria bacterium]